MAARHQPKKRDRGQRSFFLRGLGTVLPFLLTVVVFGLILQGLNQYVVSPINSVLYWALESNALGWKGLEVLGIDPLERKYLDDSLLPEDLKSEFLRAFDEPSRAEFRTDLADYRGRHLTFFRDFDVLAIDEDRLRGDVKAAVPPFVGVLISVLVVFWLGWLVGGFVGRKIMQRVDRALHLIPIVKSVYPYSKQLVDFFFAEEKFEFDTVVSVPYPSEGIWSIGFVTSSSLKTMRKDTGKNLVTCFIPSSPMPMTGYTVFIEADKLIPLPITVDEALRITMTGGVLIPPHERVRGPEDTLLEDQPPAEKERVAE